MSQYNRKRGEGILFVLSAPSGAGKTTIAEILLRKTENLQQSISTTTRGIRDGENDGVDYHFVENAIFKEMIANGDFLEWAHVHGNYYGTSIRNITQVTQVEQKDILLVIDVQGAATLQEKKVQCATIFLMPPSMEELKRRLISRGDEHADSIRIRLENASEEIKERDKFDHIVINDSLDVAVNEVLDIICKARRKREKTDSTLGE